MMGLSLFTVSVLGVLFSFSVFFLPIGLLVLFVCAVYFLDFFRNLLWSQSQIYDQYLGSLHPDLVLTLPTREEEIGKRFKKKKNESSQKRPSSFEGHL